MNKIALPRVLSVAGSDSGGGAGIQADLKTITALRGFGMTAITAITAQNTQGVQGVWPMPIDTVIAQIASVQKDLGIDSVKTGMIPSLAHVESIAESLSELPSAGKIIDPVLVASSGDALADDKTMQAFKSALFPLADVITPNAIEAARLTEADVESLDDQHRAANKLMKTGASSVLVKGGHIAGNTLCDVLHTQNGEYVFETERIKSTNTHGTGCSLASAIATIWPQTGDLIEAVRRGQAYVKGAIKAAPSYGQGENGPMNHGWNIGENT